MKNRSSKITLAAVIASLGMTTLLAAQTPKAPAAAKKPAAATKAYVAPKTPWGDPDLQGTWTSDDYINTPVSRNAQFGERLYATPEEIAAREQNIKNAEERNLQEFAPANAATNVNPPSHWIETARHPAAQTSLVVDPPNGQMPATLPEARARRTGAGAGGGNQIYNGPEDFSWYIRCVSRGPAGSILPVIYGNGSQIVQGPGYVAILQEMVHEARIIPIGGSPHSSATMLTYMGDSRGHWEGNTLVVETTNFLPNRTGIGLNGGGVPLSETARLVERFTRTAANQIKYELMVDDKRTYEKPFTISFPITQEPGYQNFEYACHEGNYAMFNSLSGSRALEKAAAAAAGR